MLYIVNLLRPFPGVIDEIFYTKKYEIEFARGSFTKNSRFFIADVF